MRRPPELVSVIVCVRDEEEHIEEQLAALAAQDYTGAWELLVVDNGCRDRTIAIVESFRNLFPRLTVVDARGRKGLNHARNQGAAAAGGELLCFCDGDDVVSPGWLRAHTEAALDADISSGRSDPELLNDPLQKSWRPTDVEPDLNRHPGFLPYASGGNCAVWADVAREIGWDERFRFG